MKSLTLFITLLLIVMFYGKDWIGFTLNCFSMHKACPLINRLLYMTLHASWMHLAVNLYALLTIAFMCQSTTWQLFAAVFIASSVPEFLLTATPVVGASGVIYALLGILIPTFNGWKKCLIVNTIIILTQSIFANIAFSVHLYCFCSGLLIGFIFSPRIRKND